jgi:WD40 repeat protein
VRLASEDHTLRVWDLESGKELALLTADGPTASCAVSLDGRTIVAGDCVATQSTGPQVFTGLTKLGDRANELHLIKRPVILCKVRNFSWKK